MERRKLLLLLLLCELNLSKATAVTEEFQANSFPFGKLKQQIEELSFLRRRQNGAREQKRDLETNDAMKLRLLSSLVTLGKRSFLARGPQFASLGSKRQQRAVANSAQASGLPTRTDRWDHLEPKPARVRLSKNGDVITMKFDVVSHAPFMVFRSAAFAASDDGRELEIPVLPSSGGTTEVSLSFPPTQCRLYDFIEFYDQSTATGDLDVAGVGMSPCRPFENGATSAISQDIHLPQHRILSGHGDVIFVEGQNASLDVEINFNGTFVQLDGFFYDLAQDKTLIYRARLIPGEVREDVRIDIYGEASAFLRIDELTEADGAPNAPSTHTEHGEIENMSVHTSFNRKIRIVLNTASRQTSGYVVLAFMKPVHSGRIVNYALNIRKIPVKLQGQSHPLPPGKFMFRNYTVFRCDSGHLGYRDGNCTLYCYAFGQDITSMAITKTDSANRGNIPALPSSRFFSSSSHAALAMNLGPRRDELDGEYVCEARDSQGRTGSLNMRLIASGFPRVDQTRTTIIDAGNGSVIVSCTGRGRSPLEVSIFVDQKDQSSRLDTHYPTTTETSASNQEITKSAVVPVSELQWPKSWLVCHAENMLGQDTAQVNLMDHVQDYYPNN